MTSADKELETGLASPPHGFPVPILALTVSAFAIGTAEFVIAGLLLDISRDLGVSIPAAGQLVTAYGIGIGLTVGINVGGKLADRGLMRGLIGMLVVLAALSALLVFASHFMFAAVAVIFLWGLAAFATIPPLQTRALDAAKEAPNVASALNVGAFNLGNAGGAFLGGLVIDWGFGLTAVPFAAALVALAGLATAMLGAELDRRQPPHVR